MNEFDKIDAMMEFLLHNEKLSDEELLNVWDNFLLASDSTEDRLSHMDELDDILSLFYDMGPTEILQLNTEYFDINDEYFRVDTFCHSLHSYDCAGTAVDGAIDFNALAEFIVKNDDDLGYHEIRNKLTELNKED